MNFKGIYYSLATGEERDAGICPLIPPAYRVLIGWYIYF